MVKLNHFLVVLSVDIRFNEKLQNEKESTNEICCYARLFATNFFGFFFLFILPNDNVQENRFFLCARLHSTEPYIRTTCRTRRRRKKEK